MARAAFPKIKSGWVWVTIALVKACGISARQQLPINTSIEETVTHHKAGTPYDSWKEFKDGTGKEVYRKGT